MTGAVRNRGGMPSFIALLAATLVVFTASPAAALPAVPPTTTEVIAGQYLVTIAPVDHGSERVVAAQLASAHHLTVLHLYEHTVQGFAARMTDDEAGTLRANPPRHRRRARPQRASRCRDVSPESDPPTRFRVRAVGPGLGEWSARLRDRHGRGCRRACARGACVVGCRRRRHADHRHGVQRARYRDRRRHRARTAVSHPVPTSSHCERSTATEPGVRRVCSRRSIGSRATR